MGLLSVVTFLPAVGAAVIGLMPPDARRIRAVALAFTVATFGVGLAILASFEVGEPGFQLSEQLPWIPAFDVSYHLAIDGISLFLVLLTTFFYPLVILTHWHHEDRPKAFFASFLAVETAVLGVFLALDLLLFYIFWDILLVPMYVIIGIWGSERRRYASVKFFLYTFLGGLVLLVGVVGLYVLTLAPGGPDPSFDYLAVRQLDLSFADQTWLFTAFTDGFLVKLPAFPVHTWLPDAHTEAPTGGSVVLAGILLKLGGYGLLRFSLPLFPDAARAAVPLLLGLSVIAIIYGALVALMQGDLKRLVAYSSVSHMGFVMLGIFALTVEAASGSVIQMINHGLSTGALFLLVGFLYERRHTREIAAFGGLARSTPVYAGLFLVVALSSLALPGLNGFVGEFPILLGTFQRHRWAAGAAVLGMVLAAVYLLWAYQRVFHGPLEGTENANTPDLDKRELAIMAPVVAAIVLIGVFPQPFFDRIEPSVRTLLEQVDPSAVEAAARHEPVAGLPAPHTGK